MIRRRMAVAVAVVGLGLGTLGVGSAHAQGEGVGPNEGTTGKARACQAQAQNTGKSVAKGLECPSFTVTFEFLGGGCRITVVGTGLMPGTDVTHLEQVPSGANSGGVVGYVDESGQVSGTFIHSAGEEGGELIISGTTAPGDPITFSTPMPSRCFWMSD